MASAARAASPPLSSRARSARSMACASFSAVRYAIAERHFARDGQVHQGAGAFAGDNLEMIGLAANDAAQRNDASIRRAGLFGGVEQDCGGGGNFQRARRARDGPARLRRLKRLRRAFQLQCADGVVETRFDDQKMRALQRILCFGRSTWLRHEISCWKGKAS